MLHSRVNIVTEMISLLCRPANQRLPNRFPLACLSFSHVPLSERLEERRKALQGHPDELFYQYILVSLEKGFYIGYDYTRQCKSSGRNLASALENSEVVQEYIQKEKGLGRIVSPMEKASAIDLLLGHIFVFTIHLSL